MYGGESTIRAPKPILQMTDTDSYLCSDTFHIILDTLLSMESLLNIPVWL
jgi:hypothetical protein